MLPATLKSSRTTMAAPVDARRAGVRRAGALCPQHVQLSLRRPASVAVRAATTAAGAWPCASSISPAGPYSGFISACVDSAPTPRCVCTHNAPTAKKRLAMATPKRPPVVAGEDRPGQAEPSVMRRRRGTAGVWASAGRGSAGRLGTRMRAEGLGSWRSRGSVWSRAWCANEYTERCMHASCHGAHRRHRRPPRPRPHGCRAAQVTGPWSRS